MSDGNDSPDLGQRGFRRSTVLLTVACLVLPALATGAEQLGRSGFDDAAASGDSEVAQVYAYWQAGQLDQVVALATSLASGGNARAQFLLGELYSRGEGVPQDEEQAAQWWLKAAEQGLAYAQNELGAALAEGRGVKADPRQALGWYRKAADQGLAQAQLNIGLLYLNGSDGVPKDEPQAVAMFRRAAAQGLGWAQFFLGVTYMNGQGVKADPQQSFGWFQKAADQGYTEAQYSLGTMYARGKGVLRDDSQAVYWFAHAAQNGHEKAERYLATLTRTMRRTRPAAGMEVREQPEPDAAVVKTLNGRQYVHILNRDQDWEEVYVEDGHMVGYISAGELRRK